MASQATSEMAIHDNNANSKTTEPVRPPMPWTGPDGLAYLWRVLVIHKTQDELLWAVNAVAEWKKRGGLPFGVEASALLVDARNTALKEDLTLTSRQSVLSYAFCK